MKKVVSLTRRAIEQYNMIEDGDKIAVGVSGGKDSLVLLNVYGTFAILSEKIYRYGIDFGYGI